MNVFKGSLDRNEYGCFIIKFIYKNNVESKMWFNRVDLLLFGVLVFCSMVNF